MNSQRNDTILVVEDDAGVARLQRRSLERAGFTVVSAATADEALEALGRHPLDLIVLDYRLPSDINGLDLHNRMKAAGHDVPVIMVTGFSEEATVIRALRAGVRDFVSKSAEYLDYLPEAARRVLKHVRTERQLAESEARLASVIASASDAILTADEESRITLFNPAAEQMFRIAAASALDQPLTRFIPQQLPVASWQLSCQPSPAEPATGNWQLATAGVRADGEEFPLEASLSCTEAGGHKFWTVVVRDVTQRKQAELRRAAELAEVRQAEERIREQAALLDLARDAILVKDMDDIVLYWNRSAERLYGWSAAEAVGRNATLLLSRQAEAQRQEAQRAILEKGEWVGELQQQDRQGKAILVESRWTLVRDEAGRPHSILVINTDITEKKKIEAQYLRTQRMESIGTLAGGIAHDLNNVLTPILMAIEYLKMPGTEPQRLPILETLHSSALRGAEMVRQVLSFAREVEGQRVPLQLKHVTREIEKMLGQTLLKSIQIQVSVPSDLWLVRADATQMSQVLMNLCVNARDAMQGGVWGDPPQHHPPGGRLTVTAENRQLDEVYAQMHPTARPGPYVILKVADTGTGIPADILDKIFDPFFTTKEQGKGTGLGLSTALGIVQGHGGFINVYSEPGRGTQFAVYLPALVDSQAGEKQAEQPRLARGAGELILVVDDEPAIREVTRTILMVNGYRVLTASDGSQAIALFAQHQQEVAAILIDMMMPVMDGAAAIRALQRLSPGVRILASSGLPAGHRPAELAGAAPDTFLAKPYTARELLDSLQAVLRNENPFRKQASGGRQPPVADQTGG